LQAAGPAAALKVVLDQGAVGPAYVRCAEGFALAAIIAAGAVAARALSLIGALSATVEGGLVFAFGGLGVAGAMVAFFGSSSVLGRLGGKQAEEIRARSAKGGRRDALQVLANGGVAAACAVASAVVRAHGAEHTPLAPDPWLTAAIGALAAASGDTWSTEIGALARGPVRSVLTGRAVAPGTSGGASLIGTLAAPLGGAFVGLIGALLTHPHAWGWVPTALVAGLAGSAFDSLLGASLQAVWRCEVCGRVDEDRAHRCSGGISSGPARTLTLERGLAWMDNDSVNALATALGAALGFTLAFV